MHLLSKIVLILSSPYHLVVKYVCVMHFIILCLYFISYAFLLLIMCMCMLIGSPKGITLLEFETVGEIPQEIPQQEA
jgi:hypothetical protein